jgi:hypothetical protein
MSLSVKPQLVNKPIGNTNWENQIMIETLVELLPNKSKATYNELVTERLHEVNLEESEILFTHYSKEEGVQSI